MGKKEKEETNSDKDKHGSKKHVLSKKKKLKRNVDRVCRLGWVLFTLGGIYFCATQVEAAMNKTRIRKCYYYKMEMEDFAQTPKELLFRPTEEKTSEDLEKEWLRNALEKLHITAVNKVCAEEIVKLNGNLYSWIWQYGSETEQYLLLDSMDDLEELLRNLKKENRTIVSDPTYIDLVQRVDRYKTTKVPANLYQIWRDLCDLVADDCYRTTKKMSCLEIIRCAAETVETGEKWLLCGNNEIGSEAEPKTISEPDIRFETGKLYFALYQMLKGQNDEKYADLADYKISCLMAAWGEFYKVEQCVDKSAPVYGLNQYYMADTTEKLIREIVQQYEKTNDSATIRKLTQEAELHYENAYQAYTSSDGDFYRKEEDTVKKSRSGMERMKEWLNS